ncbi:cyclin-dependent kinase inhibitor 3 family protein [Vibrio sp. DW001]|uniref:cyclin-dependent kinase inhibitor 3 family protein n=1 Tax=Vibrio sp. DW001 TaxID=2912315 RepID=UPI0023AED10F|nr:cyclin-dependent kinase inhibitor 3 family protein [Vibrio sp. DW001]WED26611.1 cyclin-dependent kinase inhibitor 3 family protein [Vibrio sp. DW001]
MTHPTWQLNVTDNDVALILTPCPGTKEVDLETSLKELKSSGVQAIVTALEFEEMEKAGVAELPRLAKQLGMSWFHQPIKDDEAPDEQFDARWEVISPQVHEVLKQGGNVALHCMGGSGRTGLLAAHILLELDWDLNRIKSEVQALRPGAFTKPLQIEYINQVSK